MKWPALYDDQRRALSRFATMLACGAAAILPLTAQNTSIAGASVPERPSMRMDAVSFSPQLSFPDYSVDRDPFVPDRRIAAEIRVEAAPARAGQGDDIGVVLPANAGASATLPTEQDARGPGSVAVVRAVVLGDSPRALVDIDGSVHVVGIGDAVGDAAVVRIDAHGVALSDGSRLPMERLRK